MNDLTEIDFDHWNLDEEAKPEVQTIQTSDEQLPFVSQFLIDHLRNNREWRDQVPEPDWDQRRIDRNIGAVTVIRHLKELLDQQAGRSPSN
jgi:hypothetical protein